MFTLHNVAGSDMQKAVCKFYTCLVQLSVEKRCIVTSCHLAYDILFILLLFQQQVSLLVTLCHISENDRMIDSQTYELMQRKTP